MRVKCKLTPYIHERKPEIEKYANQTEWTENNLIDVVKQSDTSHTLQTTDQTEKATKRVREEGSYVAETTTEMNFKLRYNKRPKLNPTGNEKITIEVEDTDIPVTNTDAATVIRNEQFTENMNEEQVDNENAQLIEKQQNMEASFSQTAEEKDPDIREK